MFASSHTPPAFLAPPLIMSTSTEPSIVEYPTKQRVGSKEFTEHVEDIHGDGSFVSSSTVEHYTKYPDWWSKVRCVASLIVVRPVSYHPAESLSGNMSPSSSVS